MKDLFLTRVSGFVILLFGRPGSGKDTQGERLNKFFTQIPGAEVNYFITSLHLDLRSQVNDLLAARINSFRGLRDSGGLLPANLVCEVVEEYFKGLSGQEVVILNGFPRSYEQGKDLIKIVGHRRLVSMLLDLPREKAEARLANRNQGRADDTQERIKIRQDIFEQDCAGIIQALQENRVPILEVDASLETDQVFGEMQKKLGQFFTTPAELHSHPQTFAPQSVAM